MEAIIAMAIEAKIGELASGSIPVGKHTLDQVVILRLTGEVSKSADSEYTPTTSIPLKATMAILLEKCGITREAAADMLIEAMTEALECETEPEDSIVDRIKDLEKAEKRVQEITRALPPKVRAGAVRFKVQIEEIINEPATVN